MKNVILSPHPDDIALSMGGTLSKLAQNQCEILLISFFDRGNYLREKSGTFEQVTYIRTSEDLQFAKRLQIPRISFSYPDATARQYPSIKSIFQRSNGKDDTFFYKVLSDLKSFLSYLSCKEYLIWCPLALGNHIDHLIVRDAVRETIGQDQLVLFYEDLPYACDFSFEQIDSFASSLGAKSFIVNRIINNSIANKLLLVGIYKSQIGQMEIDAVKMHAIRVGDKTPAERFWVPTNLESVMKKINLF